MRNKGFTTSQLMIAIFLIGAWLLVNLLFVVPLVDKNEQRTKAQKEMLELKVVVGEVYEPNYAIVPVETQKNPMFVVAAKEGKPNGIEEARRCLSNQKEGWMSFSLLLATENGGLSKRITSICEDLAKKGYDAKRAEFFFCLGE